jgi:hypothetical protein
MCRRSACVDPSQISVCEILYNRGWKDGRQDEPCKADENRPCAAVIIAGLLELGGNVAPDGGVVSWFAHCGGLMWKRERRCRRKGEKIKKDGEHHMHLKRYGEQWSLGHPKVESTGKKLGRNGKCRG